MDSWSLRSITCILKLFPWFRRFSFVMGSLLGKGEPGKSASFVAATGLGAPEVRIASVPVSPFTGNKTDRPDKLKLLVVQKMDNAIHQINQYPLDSATGFAITYSLDSDLSGG